MNYELDHKGQQFGLGIDRVCIVRVGVVVRFEFALFDKAGYSFAAVPTTQLRAGIELSDRQTRCLQRKVRSELGGVQEMLLQPCFGHLYDHGGIVCLHKCKCFRTFAPNKGFILVSKMIGTSNEILQWLTRHSEYAPLMCISRQRLVGLRKHLYCNELGEERKEELLFRLQRRIEQLRAAGEYGCGMTLLGCVKSDVRLLRKRYILPAVVRDKHGKYFQETTMVRMVAHEEKMQDLHLDKVCGAITRGDLPSEEVVREILRRKGWTMFEPRYEMPSVWEVNVN